MDRHHADILEANAVVAPIPWRVFEARGIRDSLRVDLIVELVRMRRTNRVRSTMNESRRLHLSVCGGRFRIDGCSKADNDPHGDDRCQQLKDGET